MKILLLQAFRQRKLRTGNYKISVSTEIEEILVVNNRLVGLKKSSVGANNWFIIVTFPMKEWNELYKR